MYLCIAAQVTTTPLMPDVVAAVRDSFDSVGAMVLNQFRKYFADNYRLLCLVNQLFHVFFLF